MRPEYDIAIVGGGPAGSSAAVHLASRGRSVLLLEKDSMPRDKLCGEFLSTEVAGLCRALGVYDRLRDRGAVPIERVRITSARGRSFTAPLPGTAFGMSRQAFDHELFDHAVRAGAEARQGCTVRRIEGGLRDGFQIYTDSDSFHARVVLGAYGRRSGLDRKLERPFMQSSSPFVAFKAHFRGEMPEGEIELHAFRRGYCGLLREESGHVNACWIGDRRELRRAGGSPEVMLEEVLRRNPHLSERLAGLDRVHDFLSAAQLGFSPKGTFAADVCMIGDAAGMIAPLCGDGMAMALATGELVAAPTDDFLARRIDAEEFKKRYDRAWRTRFARRMALGRWIHAAYVRSPLSTSGIGLLAAAPPLAAALLRATRG